MGRGVEVVSDSEAIYFDANELFGEDYGDEFIWREIIGDIRNTLALRFRSLSKPARDFLPHPYRETQVLLENEHAQITLSEYCGCGVICVAVNERAEYPELAESWILQNIDGIKEELATVIPESAQMTKLGTMSNGVPVYKRA